MAVQCPVSRVSLGLWALLLAGAITQDAAAQPAPSETIPSETIQSKTTDSKTIQSAGDTRNPVQQLSRQYARRAAAKSKEREAAAKTPPPADEIREPVVALSQGHRESCVVYVGDKLPAGSLPDAAGKAHELLASLGKKLTVVVFWNANNPYALDQFQEMQHELVPLCERGVQVMAIHVGDVPADYTQLCVDNGAGALCLVDADRSYFAQLARSKLPRTYLLDAQGKILWLDLEYSRSTRYDLRNALHYYLQD